MFGLHELQGLIKELDNSSVSELTFEVNGTKVELKKNPTANLAHNDMRNNRTVKVNLEQEELDINTNGTNETENAGDVSGSEKITEVVSPMVGTFYKKPSPEDDAYVNVGDKVNNDTVVCIVEAMKLFNEIEAETTGEIAEILVEDGELVEYGQPLFKVKLD